jgi:hypothetical protein
MAANLIPNSRGMMYGHMMSNVAFWKRRAGTCPLLKAMLIEFL